MLRGLSWGTRGALVPLRHRPRRALSCMDAALMQLELHGWGTHVVSADEPGPWAKYQGARDCGDSVVAYSEHVSVTYR
jgi:hypothetical protein